MSVQIGIAHVGATYDVNRSSSYGHVTNGVQDIKSLGSTMVKLFFSPNYATNDYPQQLSWSATPTSLTTQAQMGEFSTVLGDTGLTHVFINSWPYAGFGTGDAWKAEIQTYKGLIEAEYTEYRAFAEHLLTTYSGTGKTFVLQTWEGDWALLASVNPQTAIPMRRPHYMAGWLRARQQAVEDARRYTSYQNVTVLNAIEVNRVQDTFGRPHRTRVLTSVLPHVQPDYVSYSAYDILTQFGSTQSEHQAFMTAHLPKALAAIRKAAPNSGVYMGEFGWPENELGVGYSSYTMIDHVVDLLNNDGNVPWALYWGCYDNEGDPPDNRGFYCVDTDGETLSGAGTWINENLGGTF